MDNQISIIGGGIGGIALALALQKIGVDFRLYEKVIDPKEVGAGLTLWPNATYVLKQYNVLDEAIANSGPITKFTMYSSTGSALTSTNYTKYQDKALCIHRHTLYNILLARVDKSKIVFGNKLTDISQVSDHYRMEFNGISKTTSKYVFGVDGIHSKVREFINPKIMPKHCSYYIIRGISKPIDSSCHIGETYEYMGNGARFGAFSIGNHRLYWYINVAGKAPELIIDKTQLVISLLAKFPKFLRDIINATVPENILINDTYDIPPFSNWHKDGLLLFGDAAHASTPNLGQGACMAFEDSWCFAKLISQHGCNYDSLDKFVELRYERTKFLQTYARRFGNIGQLKNPLLLVMRNLMFKLMPAWYLNKQLNSIYRYWEQTK